MKYIVTFKENGQRLDKAVALLNSELSFVTGEHPDTIEDMLLRAMQA